MFASAALVVGAIGAGGIATAHGNDEHFLVTLRGSEERPNPADPDGRATARLDIDVDAGKVCWDLHFSRIGTPTLAHIHGPAPRGTNAGVAVGFIDADHPLPADEFDLLERGRASGCTEGVDHDVAADIVANPDQYYVNIHNTRFPAGAVRGQIR
jgi:hypothetical protein